MRIEVEVVTFTNEVVGSTQQRRVLQDWADKGYSIQCVVCERDGGHVIYLQRILLEAYGSERNPSG